jgi:hypothetical protein
MPLTLLLFSRVNLLDLWLNFLLLFYYRWKWNLDHHLFLLVLLNFWFIRNFRKLILICGTFFALFLYYGSFLVMSKLSWTNEIILYFFFEFVLRGTVFGGIRTASRVFRLLDDKRGWNWSGNAVSSSILLVILLARQRFLGFFMIRSDFGARNKRKVAFTFWIVKFFKGYHQHFSFQAVRSEGAFCRAL